MRAMNNSVTVRYETSHRLCGVNTKKVPFRASIVMSPLNNVALLIFSNIIINKSTNLIQRELIMNLCLSRDLLKYIVSFH